MEKAKCILKNTLYIFVFLVLSLLLVGCDNSGHVHNFTDWYVEKEATCKQEGLEKRICLDCELSESRTVPKSNHNATGWVIQTEATCANEGKMIKRCTTCRNVLQTKIIEKKDHTFHDEDWVVIKKATCQETGQEQRQCEYCTRKEYRQIPTTEHIEQTFWVTTKYPTCIENGERAKLCKTCNTKLRIDTTSSAVQAKGHSYTNAVWETTSVGDCSTNDIQSRKCDNCNYIDTREISSSTHDMQYLRTVAPTSTTAGYTEYKCSRCTATSQQDYTYLITLNSVSHHTDLKTLPSLQSITIRQNEKFAGINNQGDFIVESYQLISNGVETKIEVGDTINSCCELNVYWTIESRTFDNIVARIAKLEEIATTFFTNKYSATKEPEEIKEIIDKQVAIYIRLGKYNSTSWTLMCGKIETGFEDYVLENQGEYDIVGLRNITELVCPDTNQCIDFVHMFAVINGIVVNRFSISSNPITDGQLTGWGGDLCSFVVDIKKLDTSYHTVEYVKSRFYENDTSFGRLDVNADLDADNIVQIFMAQENRSYAEAMKIYYNGLTETVRRQTFYTTRRWGENTNPVGACYNQILSDSLLSTTLAGSYGLNINNADDKALFQLCCTAFVEYLLEM